MTEQNGLERSSATDELRRLLDERGVEWTEPNNKARSHTTYWTAGALRCMAVEFTDGVVSISSLSHDLTPEQAIEATLGSDLKAENAKLRELVRHMHTCLDHYEPGDTISCGQCPYDNETWGCDYERLMAELGIEVDA